ncbi:TolB family protein [Uliginosibacterium aquaticum]|uniref:Uncharacterized protein n=1 Tax=Uliginosibacterium aquaticum TaxID=2731212 RepID=A0ABX2IFJ3_9RHOO|nr:hypothetical protein [Uliginosibacterium aquaticum]NSL55454.1 hypothetical protein [Uliginosibacterium aquaticum]
MHLLLGLLFLGVLAYLFHRIFLAPAAVQTALQQAEAGRSERGFAFLSNGLLFLRPHGGELQQLHSPYVQEAIDRRERARDRHSWKQGTSFGISAGGNMRNFEAGDKPVLATTAAFEANGDLLYFLKDEGIGGLFRREAASGNELRVLLRQHLHLEDLSLSPDGSTLAASSRQSAGIANLALFNRDGSAFREVSGGDTVDAAPAWIPDAPRRLLFQSSGLARDENGYIVAQGNASIQMLDMDTGSVAPILENPRFDFLKPRVSPAGDLLFIRRPYELPRYGSASMFVDTLLFPFRLLRAVFHYLNFFSLMYTRKPLTSASGPAVQADLKSILLQGRRIDAEKALRSERPVQGVASLVPSSWELVSRTRAGLETVLATNVASYDLGTDGSIVYSNGRGVFVIGPDGRAGLALRDQLVAEVFASA